MPEAGAPRRRIRVVHHDRETSGARGQIAPSGCRRRVLPRAAEAEAVGVSLFDRRA